MRTSALLLASLAFIACSSSSSSSQPDAGPNDTSDAGADAAVPFPAPHQTAPVVDNVGGKVLAAPKLVIATFPGETFADDLDKFGKALGQSSYWKATTSEYGVGALSYATSVAVKDPAPTTTNDADIVTWLTSQLDGTHPEWGTPDTNTIYAIVYPKGTSVSLQGTSTCSGSPAYHDEITLKSGLNVPYAVVTRCDPFEGLSGIDFVTAGLSHEIVETATDPYYETGPAFMQPTKWELWYALTGGELADMCTLSSTVYFKPDDLPYTVQRSWSNAAAKAGQDPCVPAPSGTYVGAAPRMTDKVKGTYQGQGITAEGVKLAMGATTTIVIDLFSDAATDPFDVTVTAFAPGSLSVKLDKSQGKNGDTITATITRVRDAGGFVGIAPFVVKTKQGTRESIWLGAVGN